MSTSVSGPARTRLPGIDMARGVALLLMFIAHVAPSDGPLRVLLLSEFLTAPLFAMPVGIGADLAQDRVAAALGQHRFMGRQVVRAAALVGLGWWLAQSQAQVVVVLVHLGLLLVLCLPLARLRSRALAIVGLVFTALALGLPIITAHLAPGGIRPGSLAAITGHLGGWGPYRLTAFVAYAIAGMLLVRWLQSPAARRTRVLVAGLAAGIVMGALLVATNLAGIVEVHAYDGTIPETLGNLAGAAAIVLLCSWVATLDWFEALPARLVEMLVAPGQMTLTLYSWQILVLHAHGLLRPGQRDDSWTMLALLVISSLLISTLWRAAVGALPARPGRVSRGWRKGPIEGLVEEVASRLFPAAR